MGKKYLLTFSLAAISCLATKTIHEVFETDEQIVNIEKENIENREVTRQAVLNTTFESRYY